MQVIKHILDVHCTERIFEMQCRTGDEVGEEGNECLDHVLCSNLSRRYLISIAIKC